MNFAHLTSGECTDTGRRRSHNEDSLLRLPTQGLFCVADGMGGMYGGEVASKAVVDGLRRAFETLPEEGTKPSLIERSVIVGHSLNQSSAWIKRHGEERGASGAGTTAVIVSFDPADPSRALAQHAGDSRLYRWRKEKLEQLTRDHSVAAAAGLKNEKSLPHMFRGVVTRAVGLDREVKLEETPVDVAAGDLFLVCSDGLTRMVSDRDIARLLEENASADPEAIAKVLVAAANEAGGEDNISVVAIRVGVAAARAAETEQTAATHPVPTAPKSDEPADRVSDPAHMSGVTPAHDTDAHTPVTAEFQRGETSKTHERPAPEAGGEISSGRIGFAVGAFVIALVVIGALVAQRDHTAEITTTEKPVAAEPAVPAVEPAPAKPVEAPVEPAAAAPELAAARAAMKVDVREALLTGRWGALESQLAALHKQLPELGRDVPEWDAYEAWLRDWKKADFSAPPPAQLFTALREAALPLLAASGVPTEPPMPAWSGQSAADADVYCAAAHKLARDTAEAVAGLAAARMTEIEGHEAGLMTIAAKLQATVALTNGTPADALAKWKAAVTSLGAWSGQVRGSLKPVPAAVLVEAGELSATADVQKDRFFDRLVDLVKAWGYANRAELVAPEASAKSREAFALYVRIANLRRASPDARSWRAKGGEQAVIDFFRVAGEALAARH